MQPYKVPVGTKEQNNLQIVQSNALFYKRFFTCPHPKYRILLSQVKGNWPDYIRIPWRRLNKNGSQAQT